MAAKVLAFVVLLLASAQAQKLFRWTGGNMNFSTTQNWQNDFAPISPNNPCSTTFGGTTNIISQLSDREYIVGSVLNLPADGTLLLSNDGTVLSFSDAAAANPTCSGSAVWTGGLQPDQRNDFACHTNWQSETDSGTGIFTNAPTVPCQNDEVSFDAWSTYRVGVSGSVPVVVMSQLTFGTITITSNAPDQLNRLLPQIDLRRNVSSTLIITQSSASAGGQCRTLGQFANSKCFCRSSCPTIQMAYEYQLYDLQLISNTAAQNQAALNTYYTRTFMGTITPAALLLSQKQLATVLSDPTMNNGVKLSLQSLLMSGLPAASVTVSSITLSSDNSSFTVTGSLNATAAAIFPVGFTSLSPPSNVMWSATSNALPSNSSRILFITQTVIASEVLSLYSEFLTNLANNLNNQQPQPIQNIISTINSTSNPTDVLNAINAAPCISTCGASCQTCVDALTTGLVGAGMSQSDAGTLANKLVTAANADPNWSATSNNINTVVNNQVAANNAQQQLQQSAPRQYAVNSTNFYIGRTSTIDKQLLSISSTNVNNLNNIFKATISNYQGVEDTYNFQTTFVGAVPSAGARRRRAVPQTASAVQVAFTFDTTCLPVDTACFSAPAPNSALYNSLQQRLDMAFNIFTPGSPQCFTNGVFDRGCVSNLATTYCQNLYATSSNEANSRQGTQTFVSNIIACLNGISYPNGTCFQDYPYAQANSTSIANTIVCGPAPTVPVTTAPVVVATTNPVSSGASSSSGGGSSIIPIIAAVAGGVVILALIVIILLRRKNRNNNSQVKKTDDRTVVAFENPMYDDPATSATAQPTYDSAAVHDGEGLYDEPAFNQASNKANPVYQSTEDLTGGYMEQVGGGQKGGDGYLDVNPSAEKAEDVGYLDNVEKK